MVTSPLRLILDCLPDPFGCCLPDGGMEHPNGDGDGETVTLEGDRLPRMTEHLVDAEFEPAVTADVEPASSPV